MDGVISSKEYPSFPTKSAGPIRLEGMIIRKPGSIDVGTHVSGLGKGSILICGQVEALCNSHEFVTFAFEHPNCIGKGFITVQIPSLVAVKSNKIWDVHCRVWKGGVK